jgi:beta-glucosidase/6-phospho-beta-glucosidase/beta-galactosidase
MSYNSPASDFINIQPEVQNSRLADPSKLTHYEEETSQIQNKKLKFYTNAHNTETEQTSDQTFVNLSLVQLFQNMASTIIDIMNDLLKNTLSLNEILHVFIQGDRLIYIGVLMLIISFCIYIVETV